MVSVCCSATAGLTDLAGIQRGASGVAGSRPAGFTGGGSLHPAKSAAAGGGTKQPRGWGGERNGLGALREVGSNGMVSARKKHPVRGEEKILVESELVPSGGPAHGEGWDGVGKPHTRTLVVLQERCPLRCSCFYGMLGVAKVGIFWGATALSGVCVSPGSS